MTLEICRRKLNENLTENFVDQFDEIVEYLDTIGYRAVKTFPHSDEVNSQDTIFVRKDLELNFDL